MPHAPVGAALIVPIPDFGAPAPCARMNCPDQSATGHLLVRSLCRCHRRGNEWLVASASCPVRQTASSGVSQSEAAYRATDVSIFCGAVSIMIAPRGNGPSGEPFSPLGRSNEVGRAGLEPAKAVPTDLQSVPFAARDTDPYSQRTTQAGDGT